MTDNLSIMSLYSVRNQSDIFPRFLTDGILQGANPLQICFWKRRNRSWLCTVNKSGIVGSSWRCVIEDLRWSLVIHNAVTPFTDNMHDENINIQLILSNERPVKNYAKQITGVEPASSAWEANVLPMNHICIHQPERVPPGKSNVWTETPPIQCKPYSSQNWCYPHYSTGKEKCKAAFLRKIR